MTARSTGIDWPPDYTAVLADRLARFNKLKDDPDLQWQARLYYATRPIEWIEHWAVTYDPRKAGSGQPTKMPFILFPRQREFVEFLDACLNAQTDGLCEKSRDMGMTWLCCAYAVWLWLYRPGASVGFGS